LDQALVIGSRRHCDNDGKLYTVKKKDHRFCTPKCRSEYHRFGSPYLKLRERISKEVERIGEDIEYRLFTALDVDARGRYMQRWPERARRFNVRRQEETSAAAS
jgi:hypothetical protein